MSTRLSLISACAFAVIFSVPHAYAKEEADQSASPVTAPTVTIYAPKRSLTVPDIETQRDTLDRSAGSVGFVDSEEYKTRYAYTLRDVLQDTPGVFVQPRYGQEMRVSVRGSGMARGYHTRGIEILQDGIPTNSADGSGDYYQIDPLALRSVEVYKGGNGLAYGSTMLGGAINFITPTAQTAIAPNILRLEGGSFGTIRGNAQISRELGDFDFLANGTITHAGGYRDHETTQSESFNANLGYRFNKDVETRFYIGAFVVDQDLPGALSLSDALHDPTKANPAAVSGDQARNTKTERIANRTSIVLGGGKLDIDTWAIHKSLFHPIFQVIDQDGWTYGIGPRYSNTFDLAGFRNELLVGARFFGGNNTALQYQNNAGSRGAQTLDAQQDAYNYEAYLENRFWFVPQVAFMAGAKLFYAERNYQDRGGLTLNPTAKEDRQDYKGINPKFGLLWQPKQDIQAFIDVTRSQDIPDLGDLTQTTATTAQFTPLKAQDAWTLEAGTRGKHGRYTWDVTAYRSWVKNELMQFTTNPSIPAATFNAGRTVHQGVEFGASAEVLHDVFASSDVLTLSQIWNFSDFRFRGDAQYGNNRIAGVPEHLLRTELSYKHRSGFYFTPTVDWAPHGTYADQANTLKAPSYVLLGLQTGIQLENGLLFYVDARNLTDERYVSDISTIKDARTTATTVFYPGAGRSVFAGIRYTF